MLNTILTTTAIAAIVAWLGYLAVRYVLPGIPNPVTAIAESRQAARERVLRDPLDHVRAWVARIAPSRLKVEQRMVAAQATVQQTVDREKHLMTAFKDGQEPTFGFKVTVVTLFIAWVISVTAVFIIDVPIVNAVSGGNMLFAVVGTVLLVAVPVIFSVLLGHFFMKWRKGEMHSVLFSAALIGIVAFVVAIVWFLTTLAPMRAEVEYAEKIRTAEQQLAMYREDGDQNAVAFAELNLDDLLAQRERSVEWNTALIPIAAAAEFATGFFLPLAIPLLMLADVKSSRQKAERALTTTENRMRDQRARQYARLSREFQRLGLTQLELQQYFAAVAAENRVEEPGLEGARNRVARELEEQAPTPVEHRVLEATERDVTEQAMTAEDVSPDETPTSAPVAGRDRNRERERNTSTRQTPTTPAAPVRSPEPDDGPADVILNLN